MTKVLPKKKRELLDFLKKYIREHGFALTFTDIAKVFKVNSFAIVHEYLEFLEQ